MEDFKIERISIPRLSVKTPQSQSSFAVFELVVEATSNGTRLRWTVHRRYSDFEELNNKLVRSGFPGIPVLPGKRIMGNLSTAFLEERREDLETYLHGAKDSALASRSPGFMGFIGAVQFIEKQNDENSQGSSMTAFPYAMRSGRYAPTGSPRRGGEVDTCTPGCCLS